MKKLKVLTISLIFMFLFGNISTVSSKNTEQDILIKTVINKYFYNYFESFKTLNTIDSTDFIESNNNTLLYSMIHESEVNMSKKLGLGYKEYDYRIDYKKVAIEGNTANVSAILDLDYQYKNTKDIKSGLYNIDYNFRLTNKNGNWVISQINTDFDEFQGYKQMVTEQVEDGIDFVQAIEKTKKDKEKDVDVMLIQIEESKQMPAPSKLEITKQSSVKDTNSLSTQRSVEVSYYSPRGVSYAERFAESSINSRLFYTASGNDCTNFVSQCVWAAFDGYVEGNDCYSQSIMSGDRRC